MAVNLFSILYIMWSFIFWLLKRIDLFKITFNNNLSNHSSLFRLAFRMPTT